jgi:SAM-dependent methyltransferase
VNGPELYLLAQQLLKIADGAMPDGARDNVSPAARLVLSDVVRNLGATAGDIAERTGLKASQVADLVDDLIQAGLLTQDKGRLGVRRDGAFGGKELPAIDKPLAAELGTTDPAGVSEVASTLENLARRLGSGRVLAGVTDFDAAYRGTPPWDTGRPQPAFEGLAHAGAFTGRVLDVGCGTGEHALLAASLGLAATGVDTSPTAISLAREKAASRGLTATFTVHDALDLGSLGSQFDTVIDSALFHVFNDAERARYVDSLASVVPAGGRYYMICFSDRQPPGFGPRRVSDEEVRSAFASGWRVDAIEPVTLEVTLTPEGVRASLASLTRV